MTELSIQLFNETAAAHELGIKPRTLQDCRRKGRVPFRRIGRHVMYTRSDLAEFVERSKAEAAT